MSNISHDSSSSSLLQFSHSSGSRVAGINHERISQSVQYLDRIRSINKKIFDSRTNENKSSLISPLQKLINSQRDITFIDNEKIYGIIKIEILSNLKNRIKQLENQQEEKKIIEHQLQTKIIYLNHQLEKITSQQSHLNDVVKQIKQYIQQEKQLRINAEKSNESLSATILQLMSQKIEDQRKIIALKAQFSQYKFQKENHFKDHVFHYMICQTQTQFYKPTIEILPFQPNLQEILRKLRQKQGQKISRPTLKQVIEKSLQAFIKELDSQYKLIHQQTIDLTNLREQNQNLIEQNSSLKKSLEEIHIEEEKLKIFKNCMSEFLTDASDNVSKSIESERDRKIVSYQSEQQQSSILSENGVIQISEQMTSLQKSRLKQMQQKIVFLKKENLTLLKTLGQYQFKWKNVEKVLDDKNKEEVCDEGTVGQLVKISKLVKDSIKNLLQQI